MEWLEDGDSVIIQQDGAASVIVRVGDWVEFTTCVQRNVRELARVGVLCRKGARLALDEHEPLRARAGVVACIRPDLQLLHVLEWNGEAFVFGAQGRFVNPLLDGTVTKVSTPPPGARDAARGALTPRQWENVFERPPR